MDSGKWLQFVQIWFGCGNFAVAKPGECVCGESKMANRLGSRREWRFKTVALLLLSLSLSRFFGSGPQESPLSRKSQSFIDDWLVQSWWDKLKIKRKAAADDGYPCAGVPHSLCTYYWRSFWHWTLSKMPAIDTPNTPSTSQMYLDSVHFSAFPYRSLLVSANNPYPVILLASLSLKHLKRPVSCNFHPNWAQSNRSRAARVAATLSSDAWALIRRWTSENVSAQQ